MILEISIDHRNRVKTRNMKTVIHSLFRLNKLCKRMRIQHLSDSRTAGILRLNRIEYYIVIRSCPYVNIELLCTMYNGYYFHTCTQSVDTREGWRTGRGGEGLPVESKFGGLRRRYFITKLHHIFQDWYYQSNIKGVGEGGGGARASPLSKVWGGGVGHKWVCVPHTFGQSKCSNFTICSYFVIKNTFFCKIFFARKL